MTQKFKSSAAADMACPAPASSASPEAFAKLIRDDDATFAKVVTAAGIKPE